MNRAGVFNASGGIHRNRTLRRDSFDESSFSGDRGSFSDNMYATIGNNTPSMSSDNGSSLGGRNPPETEHLFPAHNPEDSVTASRDVDNLKATNRRLEVVFHLVTGLCVVVIALYIIAIACFVIKMQQQHQLRSPSSSGSRSNGDELPNCVDKDELTAFKKIWDPEDRRHVTGGDELSYTFKANKFCFHDLRWLPLFMGKMNAAVDDSVKFIENQQTRINDTLNKYLVNSTEKPKDQQTRINDTLNKCLVNSTEKPKTETQNPLSHAACAHFFLDTATDTRLVWSLPNGKGSTVRGVKLEPSEGKVTIVHSGTYYLYTRIAFNAGVSDSHNTIVNVVRRRAFINTTLLQSSSKLASLQGVFLLHEEDELVVEAPRHLVYSGNPMSTYFGLYLIRV